MASTAGSRSSGIGGGCIRRGPTSRDGEHRSLHTGSNSTRRPSTSTSADEWPYQTTCSPSAETGASPGVTSGTGPDGRRRWRPTNSSRSIAGPDPGGIMVAGTLFRNAPSRYCGDRRSRWARAPDGRTPIAAGMSRTAHAAAAAPTTASPNPTAMPRRPMPTAPP